MQENNEDKYYVTKDNKYEKDRFLDEYICYDVDSNNDEECIIDNYTYENSNYNEDTYEDKKENRNTNKNFVKNNKVNRTYKINKKTKINNIDNIIRNKDIKTHYYSRRLMKYILKKICKKVSIIEEEVLEIEHAVSNPYYGLKEIKEEINKIERMLKNEKYCLKKIAKRIKKTNIMVGKIYFRLKDMKKDIEDIKRAVYSDECGLQVIEDEVSNMTNILLNGTFGLEEINDGVQRLEIISDDMMSEIEDINTIVNVACSNKLTSGPISRNISDDDRGLILTIQNTLLENVQIKISIYDLQYSNIIPVFFETVDVIAGKIHKCLFDLDQITNYEIGIECNRSGIYYYSIRGDVTGNNLLYYTQFKYCDFVRKCE